MFAASIPISFAGWGIREISAVVALGAIGVSATDALVIAVTLGLGSLLTMTIVVAVSTSQKENPAQISNSANLDYLTLNLNYERALFILLPLLVSILIPFQLHVPIGNGLLNVNLADPLAILAGASLAFFAIKEAPSHSFVRGPIIASLSGMTFALTLALAIGIISFGLTPWAATNRYVGWYLLLCYFSVGALCSQRLGTSGLRTLGLTLASAIAAIALLDLILISISYLGIRVPKGLRVYEVEGFAQNRNAFAFQVLIALAFVMAFARNTKIRMILLLILYASILLAGSRAGWGAFAVLLAIGTYYRVIGLRELIAITIMSLANIGLAIAAASWLKIGGGPGAVGKLVTEFILPNESTTTERMYTIAAAWDLFASHPLFGAGLGAFVHQELVLHQRQLVIHSTPLWMLAELGLVGTAFFVIPAIALAVRCKRLANGGDPTAILLILVLAVFGTMSLVHDLLFQRIFWLVIGACSPLILSDRITNHRANLGSTSAHRSLQAH
jgi:O-antigen ligase